MSQDSNSATSKSAQQYANPIPDRDAIIALLDQHGEALTREKIASALGLSTEDDLEALRRRLIAMSRDGQLHSDRRRAYWPVDDSELVTGTVIGHREGFGFLKCPGRDTDFVLHSSQMAKVFDGDVVQALPNGFNNRGREEARIIKILEQNTHRIIGCLKSQDGQHYIEPENQRITHRIEVPVAQLAGAKLGQYVMAELISYPYKRNNAMAKITEVIGDPMAPGMEINVAIRSHEIPHIWPQAALEQAKKMASEVSEQDKRHRVDLRTTPFVTIDGEDAKDFDDAVFCEPAAKGSWRLLVAIADVSHYIHPNSPLDEEAQKRGTSVYFPGHVVPMLPEAISNGLCSLNPHVDRLVMVCEMNIDATGQLANYQFFEAVIHSHARLTYSQVACILERSDSRKGIRLSEHYRAVLPQLHDLHSLYAVLREARNERGAIDFETQETSFKFDQQRKIEQIVPVVRNDAHKIIEECMLCANVATARFLEQLKLPALYRVHQGPKEKKLTSLRAFLGQQGLQLGGGEAPTPADYNRLLSSTSERADAQVIQTILLRSMSQAIYSPENQGHFGLNFDAYAHFTSPIRRYPDLLVHRAIRSVIRAKESGGLLRRALKSMSGKGLDPVRRIAGAPSSAPKVNYPYQTEQMLILAEHCSQVARRADAASWDVDAWLKCEYMQDRVGECFTGMISGLNNFGLYIELQDSGVEGALHVSALQGDFYHFDAAKQRLTGENSRKSYAIGQQIQVKIARVDMEQRKIELVLAEQQGQSNKRKSKAKSKAKTKSIKAA
ncbi:ribonuclease R [Agarivorans sp. QJM3NY_25]|uniref:ribonuclease R n=1 Tax=Agarivorans sp. QJM3NY_25 TaxID=3421430 RepID=UPI003D7DEE8E